jgi:hypothetical protein
MTCRRPIEAAQGPNGGKPVTYKTGHRPKTLADGYRALELPCGQCVSCRLEKSRVWAMRMTHEAAYWEEFHNEYSWFVTLTYDDNHLPYCGTLCKDDIQNFFKRLRWHFGAEKLRYYVVGEYGATCPHHEIENCPQCGSLQRPHYHAIIFGWSDLVSEVTGQGEYGPIYHSDTIEKAWTKRDKEGNKTAIGLHQLEPCTFETCAYVARYIMKKQTGDEHHVADHYCKYIWQLDAWADLEPEFAFMSKNPGIGKLYLDEYMHDIYAMDEAPIHGRCTISKPPKYYDGFYEKARPDHMAKLKEERRDAMARSLAYGPSLESRAKVQDARLKLLKRDQF